MARSAVNNVIIAVLLLFNLGRANAFWRLLCDGSVGLARMDPLMNYGTVGDHVHSIKGGSAFGTTSTSADLLNSKCASCSVAQDKSAYWTPAVYFMYSDGSAEVVPEKPPHKSYYFLNTGVTHDGKPQKIEAFPAGFQMISGNNYNRNTSVPNPDPNPLGPWTDESQDQLAERALGFNCLNYAKGTDEPSLMRHSLPEKSYLDANCADGIRLELMFPSCWDGQNDSDNHRSHVAFPDGVMTGNCPQGYDRRLVSLFYETIIATDAYKDKDGQFVIANGDPTGYGYHGDFIAAWESGVLQQAIDTCTSLSGDQEACEVFKFPTDTGSCALENPLPTEIDKEAVKGPRDGLPGGLKIQSGPEPATKPGQQPAAIAQPSTAALPSSSIAKAPVVPLSSQAAVAESTHVAAPQESGGVFAQVNNYQPQSEASPKVAVDAPSSHASQSSTTQAPLEPAPAAPYAITTSYTTIGREVMEDIRLEVDITVTAGTPEATAGHHKRHHKHHAANGHGIGGRRLQ